MEIKAPNSVTIDKQTALLSVTLARPDGSDGARLETTLPYIVQVEPDPASPRPSRLSGILAMDEEVRNAAS
jgi:hypothetical protein